MHADNNHAPRQPDAEGREDSATSIRGGESYRRGGLHRVEHIFLAILADQRAIPTQVMGRGGTRASAIAVAAALALDVVWHVPEEAPSLVTTTRQGAGVQGARPGRLARLLTCRYLPMNPWVIWFRASPSW